MTDEQRLTFESDGYLLIRRLFSGSEIAALRDTARRDRNMQDAHLSVQDADGRTSRLSVWNEAGDDLYGRFARCRRVADSAETLLGDEVYHYHSKLSVKDSHVGGAWEWHQDYGYWYNNGCLYPTMLSACTAIDRCDRENGSLLVLRGSHLMGRIDHGTTGTQTGADPERLAAALDRLEVVHVTQEPGDTLFFHCNLLHSSSPNSSDRPRWTLITAYNTRSNNPYKASEHPVYMPLSRVDDEQLLAGLDIEPNRKFLRK